MIRRLGSLDMNDSIDLYNKFCHVHDYDMFISYYICMNRIQEFSKRVHGR